MKHPIMIPVGFIFHQTESLPFPAVATLNQQQIRDQFAVNADSFLSQDPSDPCVRNCETIDVQITQIELINADLIVPGLEPGHHCVNIRCYMNQVLAHTQDAVIINTGWRGQKVMRPANLFVGQNSRQNPSLFMKEQAGVSQCFCPFG